VGIPAQAGDSQSSDEGDKDKEVSPAKRAMKRGRSRAAARDHDSGNIIRASLGRWIPVRLGSLRRKI